MKQEEIKSETGVEKLEQAAKEMRALGDQIRGNGSHKQADEKPRVDVATEAVAEIRKLADEIRSNAAEQRALLLGSIEALLAGADILSMDLVETLRAERDVLQGGMQSQEIEDEDRRRRITFEQCEAEVKQIEKILDTWLPDKQAAILSYASERLPEKERAWVAESARDEARDAMLNYLGNERSMDQQTEIFVTALAAIKVGNGLIEFKKAG